MWIQEWKSRVEGHLTFKLDVLTQNLPPVLNFFYFFTSMNPGTSIQKNGFDESEKISFWNHLTFDPDGPKEN